MREPLPECILDEGMRICIDVIRLLEGAPRVMHAHDFMAAARFIRRSLRELDDGELLALARSGRTVLNEAAESLLFERGLDWRIDDVERRRCAAWLAEQAMNRLRRGEPLSG